MKKYFALSLLIVNVACAEQQSWTEWSANQAYGAWNQTQNAAGAVWNMAAGSKQDDDSVPTPQEMEKKSKVALHASHQAEQDLRQAMRHERTVAEKKVYDEVAHFMFLIEQCQQADSECDGKQLAALQNALYAVLDKLKKETLAGRSLLQKRHKQAVAVEEANGVVQQGHHEGAVIGVDDDEKKKILDEKYIEAVRTCHLQGRKCDKKYLSQLRDEKNAYEKEWMKKAVENNNRMIAARDVIIRGYSMLTNRSDVEAFAQRYGMMIEKREPIVEQPVPAVVVVQEEVVEESVEKEADTGEALS